jgi:hypothetical protein
MGLGPIQRVRLVAPILACLLGFLLTACGGGGGGGESNPRQNSQRGDFTLSTSTVAFAGKIGGPAPLVAVGVQLSDTVPASVAAGYRTGVTPANWLRVSATGSGSNYNFLFSTQGTSSMAAGTYQTTITIATTDSTGNPLVTKDVQVTLTLREGVLASGSGAPIEAVVGSSVNTFPGRFNVSAPTRISWQITSNVPWLTLTGNPQGQGTAQFDLAINTSTLPVGDQQARVTVTNTADPTDTAIVVYTVRMAAPVLTLSAPTLLLGGQSGLDSRTGNLSFSINTGTNGHPWTATISTTSGGNWLHGSLANGSVSATQQGLVLDADVSSLTRGTYTGSIAIAVQVNGMPFTANVPVTVNVDSNRLVISATGVAFSSVPGRQVLTRTLTLANSLDLPDIAWHANSSEHWLQVTPSGNGSNITLTADPTSLTPGQYLASVEITPDSTSVVNTQTVRVGLYVSNSAPSASIDIAVANAEFTASNPVVPEFYTLEGTSVRAYDAYSGALLRTLATTITGTPQNMTTSDDGRVIYLLTDSINADGHVFAIDAVNGGIQSTSLVPYTGGFQQGGGRNGILYMRPDARPVVVAGVFGQYLDVTTGGVRRSAGVDISNSSTVSANQRRMYTAVQPFSPSEVRLQEVRYSTLLGEGLMGRNVASNSGHFDPGTRGNCGDIALSADQSRVHLACGGPYQFDVLNADTLVYQNSLPGTAYPINIETSWNGLVAAAATTAAPMNANLWIYDGSGVQRALLGAGGVYVFQRTLRFSGDGTRLLTTTDTGMRIQDAPIP